MSVTFKNPKNLNLPDDTEALYKKLRPVKDNKRIKKIPFEKLSKVAYLWDTDPPESKEGIDDFFRQCPEEFKKIDVYGYHTYGGFYGFFRPSLDEVIKIGEDIIRNNEVVFVTTEPCNLDGELSDIFRENYDSKLDMHLARTTFWVYNPEKN